MRSLLDLLLKDEGHQTATAPDGTAALDMISRGAIRPELIVADYNLPNGMDGLQLIARLRGQLHHQIPVIILTADISTDALRAIAQADCVQINKPMKLKELTQAIQRLLAVSPDAAGRDPETPST